MSLTNEYTDNIFMDETSILDAHLRLLFRAFHYETPCIYLCARNNHKILKVYENVELILLLQIGWKWENLRKDFQYNPILKKSEPNN